MLARAALGLLAPGGARAKLSILIFHRVLPRRDELHDDIPDTQAFELTMSWVARWFNVMPLDAAVDALQQRRLPPRAAAITFDDGYADNLTVAVPVLRRHGLCATFFIATGYLDGGRMWNDTVAEALRRCPAPQLDLSDLGLGVLPLQDWRARRRALVAVLRAAKYLPQQQRQQTVDAIAVRAGQVLPDDLMLTTPQLRALRDAGMQIGAHTVTHPILTRLQPAQARDEIVASRRDLEQRLQQPVTLFAYPNGSPGTDYDATHAAMVKDAGLAAAFSTAAGAARTGDDPFQLPRFTPWDRTAPRFALRMGRNLGVVGRVA